MRAVLAVTLAFTSLVGCTDLPTVKVTDRVPNEAQQYVKDGVRVVKAEHAHLYTDPAWPSPIQVVSPEKNGATLDGEYEVALFGDKGEGRISTVWVTDGDEGECKAAFDELGFARKYAGSSYIEVGSANGLMYRCGSVLIKSDSKDLTFSNPFITQHKTYELVSRTDQESSNVFTGQYPISIRYLSD